MNMFNNSKICTVHSIAGDSQEIKNLADVSFALNFEVQQAYESHDTVTSSGSGSARRYQLGPCISQEYNKLVAPRLSKYNPFEKSNILVKNYSSLVSGHSWCKESCPITEWHIPDESYCKWVKKLEERLGQKWHDLRIYEAIMLSTRLISFDGSLISALRCFWDRFCNGFLLPEGLMGITMEDVVAITSCSPVGIELSTLGTDLSDAKNTYQGIVVTNYDNFLSISMALRDRDQEEMAFYLYWICKFIVCNRSFMFLKGFHLVAETIFHATGPIAIAPFLLGHVYSCLGNILKSHFSEHVSGPLWLVVLWAQAYFKPIAARSIATHLSSPRQQHFNGIYSYGDYIIFSQVQCEKTFEECFNYLTDSRRKRQGEEWNPFLKRKFGADWFRTFTLHQKHTSDEKDAWKAILFARNLPTYLGHEPYSPNQFARQLGHQQSVPVPFYQTVHQIHWFPSSDHAFNFWWSWYWANVATYLPEARKHFVSKFGNGPWKIINKKRRSTRTLKFQRVPKRRAKMVSAFLEPLPGGGGGGKVRMEEVESSPEEDLPSNKKGQGEQVEDDKEESSPKEAEDVDRLLTKLRHLKPSAAENDRTLEEHPSSEGLVNNEHNQDAVGESETTPQQNHGQAVNVEQHRKKLKQYMDMSIESIFETCQLNSMRRTVDTVYHHSGDALETPILGDLRKQLTGLDDKFRSHLFSVNSAKAELKSLCKKNPDLPTKLNQVKLAVQVDESKLSELTSEEGRLEVEIQKLIEKKESVRFRKASAAESVERGKQKMVELKDIDANIKKAEYSCFQKQNEINKVNATINVTLMDARRVLFK